MQTSCNLVAMSSDDGSELNGTYHRLTNLENRFDSIEQRLVDSIVMLSGTINRLGDRLESTRRVFENAVHIKIVFHIFALVFFLIAGIEGIKWMISNHP